MKTLVLIAMFGALTWGGAAAAENAAPELALAGSGARTQVRDALEAEATLPAEAPSLPEAAAQKARDVHATTAFGQKGAVERAAHAQVNQDARDAASRARADAANRAAQGAAASAARNANADSHAAAGQDRQDETRSHGGSIPGGGGKSHSPRNLLR